MADEPKVKQDRAAWTAGFLVGRNGLAERCPYPMPSDESLAWHSGLIEGKAKRQAQKVD